MDISLFQWCVLLLLCYSIWMIIYRVFIERPKVLDAPSLKGWEVHYAEVSAIVESFRTIIGNRCNDHETVVIQRSNEGEASSNRTKPCHYKRASRKIDLSQLNGVIAIDHVKGLIHVQPGISMDELTKISIANGYIPLIVLEFPGITAGGAMSGGALESTSNQYGTFFDTVQEVDVIVGNQQYLTRVSRNNHPDLFYGLNATYGTNGIITRLAVRIKKAPKYIHLRYLHLNTLDRALEAMEDVSNNTRANQGFQLPLFIDGVALEKDSIVAVFGTPVDKPPTSVPFVSLRNRRWDPWFFWHLTDISRMHPAVTRSPSLHSSLQQKASWWIECVSHHGTEEYMHLEDYLFRFDRGAFWMAQNGLKAFFGELVAKQDDVSMRGLGGLQLSTCAIFASAWWMVSTLFTAIGTPLLKTTIAMAQQLYPSQISNVLSVRIMLTALLACALTACVQRSLACMTRPIVLLRVKYAWICTTRQLYRILHTLDDEFLGRLYVIQDFIMPSKQSAVALSRFTSIQKSSMKIWPLWVCPVRKIEHTSQYDAGFGFPETTAGALMINIGVYGNPFNGQPFDPVILNRKLEATVSNLGGRKMLYAQSYYTREEFWALFKSDVYRACRIKYGNLSVFPDLTKKLLMDEENFEKKRGKKKLNIMDAGWDLWIWYATLWGELILPRCWHSAFGIAHTGMIQYKAVS